MLYRFRYYISRGIQLATEFYNAAGSAGRCITVHAQPSTADHSRRASRFAIRDFGQSGGCGLRLTNGVRRLVSAPCLRYDCAVTG